MNIYRRSPRSGTYRSTSGRRGCAIGRSATGSPNQAAADRLAPSIRAYLQQRNGKARVTRQTIKLAFYTSVHRHNWLEVAELALNLARMNPERENYRRKSDRD